MLVNGRTWGACVNSLALLSLVAAAPAAERTPPATSADLDALVGEPVREHTGAPGYAALAWRKAELLIEWGFREELQPQPLVGSIEATQTGMLGAARPLPGDSHTAMTGVRSWESRPAGEARRGIVVPVLYTDAGRGPARTIVTVRTSSGSFSFLPVDLARGPMLVSDWGFFICRVSPQAASPGPAAASLPLLWAGALLRDKLELAGKPVGWGRDTPVVYANAADSPLSLLNGAIVVPPRTVVAHPGADRDVVIGWQSPVDGRVRVRAEVTDGHPSGGDGVTWAIVRESSAGREVLAEGAIDRGGSETVPAAVVADKLAAVQVQRGDCVALVIGRRGNHFCDTTFVKLVVAEAEGTRRGWDLARDVVDDIVVANPHPDSFGTAGVWHFLAPESSGMPRVVQAPLPFPSQATDARQYLDELARHRPKTVRQRVREHPEQTWANAMRALHGDAPLPPRPEPTVAPRMSVDVPEADLNGLWRLGAWRIINRCPRVHRDDLPKVLAAGDVTPDCRLVDATDPHGLYVVRDHPFPPLGCETDRILWALDHLGMHEVAADGIGVWLAGQQQDGALSLNSGMEGAHKIGALQLLWIMTEHYRLTGDRAWLSAEAPRLKAAADWVLDRRKATMKRNLTPEERAGIVAGTFSPYGLQPKVAMGDGDPSGSRYYYWADACGYRSVKLFSEIIAEVDAALGAQYAAAAASYRRDILPVLNESIVLSPVLLVQDGTYRSFHPQGFQDRGPLAHVLAETANIYSHCGPYHADYVVTSAAIEAWLRAGVLSVDDPRVDSHFDVIEDVFLWDHPWFRRRKATYEPQRDWFDFGWAYQSGWERLPEYYLVKDDIPNFLRAWLNRCAVDLNLADYTFNEHTTFAENDKSHGYAVFLSNFRNLLAAQGPGNLLRLPSPETNETGPPVDLTCVLADREASLDVGRGSTEGGPRGRGRSTVVLGWRLDRLRLPALESYTPKMIASCDHV